MRTCIRLNHSLDSQFRVHVGIATIFVWFLVLFENHLKVLQSRWEARLLSEIISARISVEFELFLFISTFGANNALCWGPVRAPCFDSGSQTNCCNLISSHTSTNKTPGSFRDSMETPSNLPCFYSARIRTSCFHLTLGITSCNLECVQLWQAKSQGVNPLSEKWILENLESWKVEFEFQDKHQENVDVGTDCVAHVGVANQSIELFYGFPKVAPVVAAAPFPLLPLACWR